VPNQDSQLCRFCGAKAPDLAICEKCNSRLRPNSTINIGGDDVPLLSFSEFQFVREEIRFQHSLLGSRIGSYLAAQAFLFIAFASAADPQKLWPRNDHPTLEFLWCFPFLLLPCLGIGISFLVRSAIRVARRRIDAERRLLKGYPSCEAILPKLEHKKHKNEYHENREHTRSLQYLAAIPWSCVLAWLVILVYGVCRFGPEI